MVDESMGHLQEALCRRAHPGARGRFDACRWVLLVLRHGHYVRLLRPILQMQQHPTFAFDRCVPACKALLRSLGASGLVLDLLSNKMLSVHSGSSARCNTASACNCWRPAPQRYSLWTRHCRLHQQ